MELQTLVEEIVHGVLITDAQGNIIHSNRLGCSILQDLAGSESQRLSSGILLG